MAKTQTFTAQCSKVGNFAYSSYFTLYVVLTDRDGSSSTNKSYVDYNVYCQSSGSGSINSNHYKYFSINGEEKINKTEKINVSSPNAYISIASGTIEVEHEADGSKVISFSAEIKGSTYGVAASLSKNFTLEPIARKGVLKINSVSTTINTATVNYTHISGLFYYIQYSLNGGAWQDSTGNPNMVITGLTENTTYNVRVRALNEDKTIIGDASNSVSFTTYNKATLTAAPNFNDENNPTITYTNPFGSNVEHLEACISYSGGADISYREIPKTGTSYTFSLTEAERNILRAATPNSNTLSVNFYIRTIYNGVIYYSILQRTLTIVNANPTFSNFTYKEIDDTVLALTGDNQTVVNGYSNIRATVSVSNKAIAKKYATMKNYKLSVGNLTSPEIPYSSYADINMEVYNITSNTFTVYAKDSRGNSTPKQILASKFLNYFPIKVTSILVTRKNSVLEETTLTFSGIFWNSSFGNVHNSIKGSHYKYRKVGTSEWKGQSEISNFIINGNTFSWSSVISGDLGAAGFDMNNSYEINVAIIDELSGDDSVIFTLGPGSPAIAIYKNNVAIGGRYDSANNGFFQVHKSSQFKKIGSYSNSMSLDSINETNDSVYYELYKNGSRAAWMGFGSPSSNLMTIKNETGGELFSPQNFTWESTGYSNVNYNDFKASGTYYMTENCTNGPGYSYLRLLVMGASYSGDVVQIASSVENGKTWIRGCSNGSWHQWIEINQIWHKGVADDFNDFTTTGIYICSSTPTGANTPISMTGILEVINNEGLILQRYTTYEGSLVFQRGYNSGWTVWKKVAGTIMKTNMLSARTTVSGAAWAENIIPLDTTKTDTSIGLLSARNYGISIESSNINTVKISASISFYNYNATGEVDLHILKNSEVVARAGTQTTVSNQIMTIVTNTVGINVSSEDVIYLSIIKNTDTSLTLLEGTSTSLTVEVIN